MNKQNQLKIRKWVEDHQDNMNLRLPDLPRMHQARNAWCHLFGCLADVYGVRDRGGYKVIPDSEFDHCIRILTIAYKYAEDPDVYSRFPKYELPKQHSNLEQWFM